jgi:plasmid rolling circle replication initiator protein Rep
MTEKEKPLRDVALAGDFTNKGQESLSLQKRIDKYTIAKRRQGQILNHLEGISSGLEKTPSYGVIDYSKVISNLSTCFNYLVFHNYYTVDKLRLIKATSCKQHLLCAPCAIRRAAKAVECYLGRFNEIIALQGDLEPYLLTLTIKNGHDLQERFEHLAKSMKAILKSRRNFDSRNTGFNEFCKIDGGVYSFELSHSEHGWHPHIHIVVLLRKTDLIDFNPRKPKDSQLSKDWKNITGDSFIVDIRPIKGDPAEGFVEVFKYALKFSDLTSAQTVEAYSFLRGKRLQGSFGSFRGVEVPTNLNDEALAELPYIELIYKYLGHNFSLTSAKNIEI